MGRLKSETMLTAQEAGQLLGYDYQTLRNLIKTESLPSFLQQFVKACKTREDGECYTYMVPKYWVCMYMGLDPMKSTVELLEMVKRGEPPYIDQVDMMGRLVLRMQKEKDTPTDQSTSVLK